MTVTIRSVEAFRYAHGMPSDMGEAFIRLRTFGHNPEVLRYELAEVPWKAFVIRDDNGRYGVACASSTRWVEADSPEAALRAFFAAQTAPDPGGK